ncbi:MAG TPA: ATP-binding protein [Acidimicrobiales bacterium]|nr:ATP-binding protein [Acidimicrobiales bacterium]
MRSKRAGLVAVVGACIVLALLAVFALELSDTQTRNRNEVKGQVHDRAVLAAALIDSLFQTVQQQVPTDAQTYGGQTVPNQVLDAKAGQDIYLVLLDSNGEVLASSQGFDAQASSELPSSTALALLRSGHLYGLGDYLPYKQTGVIDFAVSFPTGFGTRTLVTGFAPSALSTFVNSELKNIPGVRGSFNYLLDGNGVVLASTNPASKVGHPINAPGATSALKHTAGDSAGTYFDQAHLKNSTWRVVLSSPDGPLFATVTGWRQLVPWIIFGAFAVVAIVALLLGLRLALSADELRVVNLQLARVNQDLVDANASLERRAAELARSNEELDQFASIASHDLQEPLRKVRTFTEQLAVMESDHVSELGREYLRRANAAAERMQRLIEDLLKFSRVSTQGRPFTQVDLGDVAHEVVSDLETQIADAGALVRLHELPVIEADALQMQQLLQNLVSNAVKFRKEGVQPEIYVSGEIEGDIVRLTVRDNGIGFEPRYSLRIFRVFERLHGRSEYSGTGIGLALCRKIADRHGGTIEADSEPGAGSTFTVLLPVHQRDKRQNLTLDVSRDPVGGDVPGEAVSTAAGAGSGDNHSEVTADAR